MAISDASIEMWNDIFQFGPLSTSIVEIILLSPMNATSHLSTIEILHY
jgi:hypothetical protein